MINISNNSKNNQQQSIVSTVPLEVINGGHGQLVHFRRENTKFCCSIR